MKKLSFLLISLLAVTLFTSCNKEEDRVTKQTFSMVTNTRGLIGFNDVVFSQGTTKGEIDYTNMTFTFTADYKDINGAPHTIATPIMKLMSESGTFYSFQSSDSGQFNVDDFVIGYIDFSTGMLWYTIGVGDVLYVSTSNLLYAYTTTTVTNPENGNHYSHQQSAYLFAPDSKGQTCTMQISNFVPNMSGAAEISEIKYEGLKLVPFSGGYKISGNDLQPSNIQGRYTITDLQIVLDAQCSTINGSFKCNGMEIKMNGELLPGVFDN